MSWLSGSLEMHVGVWIWETAQVLPPCALTFSESTLFQRLNAWPLLAPMSLTTACKALLLSVIIVMSWVSALPCQDFGLGSLHRQISLHRPFYLVCLFFFSLFHFNHFSDFFTNCFLRIQMKNPICIATSLVCSLIHQDFPPGVVAIHTLCMYKWQ